MKYNICVAILGARMHYAVPEIFYKNNMLGKMYSDLYIGNKPKYEKIINKYFSNYSSFKSILGRKSSIIPSKKVVSFDFEGIYFWKQRKNVKTAKEHSIVNSRINTKFNNLIINNLKWKECDAIYGFNTASLELFEVAKEHGKIVILEQTIAPKEIENQIMEEEIKKHGNIDTVIEIDLENPMIERERKEWDLADIILAPSNFVYESLIKAGVDEKKCKIVPYGVDINKFTYKDHHLKGNEEVFNIFFAGHVGLRKGMHYLFKAINNVKTKNIRVKIAGNITLDKDYLSDLDDRIELLGRIPRTEMASLYEWADLFVFPSLCEGSATVIYEAMLSGLPVITTPNAGSIITNNIDGIILQLGDTKGLANTIDELANNNEVYNKLVDGVKESRSKASIETYEKNLINTLEVFFKEIK